ncbi:MAG: hypothetical protein V1829_01200 [bacterium]
MSDYRKIETKQKRATPQINTVEFFIVLCLAILKDVSDWILTLATIILIGPIISLISDIIITGILWFWCIFRLRKFPTKRFISSFLIEITPLLGTLVPTWTIFIISIRKEKSI